MTEILNCLCGHSELQHFDRTWCRIRDCSCQKLRRVVSLEAKIEATTKAGDVQHGQD